VTKDYSHQFKQIPGQAFRTVRGFTTQINRHKQGRHIPGSSNYIPGRSPLSISFQEAQQLIEHYAGAGRWQGGNKEVVRFPFRIGTYIHNDRTTRTPTPVGVIHYSRTGAHLVPANPDQH